MPLPNVQVMIPRIARVTSTDQQSNETNSAPPPTPDVASDWRARIHDRNDYAFADLALRAGLSAGSCFWRGGQVAQAPSHFEALLQAHPSEAATIRQAVAELQQDYAAQAS